MHSSRSERTGRRRAAHRVRGTVRWEAVWSGNELDARIIEGSLTASGYAARVVMAGPVSPGHAPLGAGSGATVFVRGREAEEARQLLEGRGERANVTRASGEGIADNARAVLRMAAITIGVVSGLAVAMAVIRALN